MIEFILSATTAVALIVAAIHPAPASFAAPGNPYLGIDYEIA